MDGKPVAQMFADDLQRLITDYKGSGLSNAECVGVLHMADIDMISQIRDEAIENLGLD